MDEDRSDVVRVLRGDTKAFRRLVVRYEGQLLALTRNMGQLIGIAAVVALWANRTLANLPPELAGTITDAAHATPEAIAAGTQETFLALAGIIGLTVLLGLVAVWIERRQG